MEKLKEQLTSYLKEKYNPVAIVLHGSRANSNAQEHSDWDFVIFSRNEVETHREIVLGADVEVKNIIVPIPDEKIGKRLGFFFRKENIETLYDPENIVPDLLEKNEHILEGGNKFTEAERIARFAFLTSSINRIRDNLDNPLVVFAKKAEFYDRAIPAWFRFLHKEFRPSDYIALPRIKSEDPNFYELLERFIQADSLESVEYGEKIIEHLFPDLKNENA
jgi:predicted nucleotidyltransferase